jgi:serine phosphatase RsbU (regulator of sigma subunit)
VVYSDGISEAMNSAEVEFGEDRLRELVARNRDDSAALIIEKLFEAVHTFAQNGSPQDDMTAVILKRLSS